MWLACSLLPMYLGTRLLINAAQCLFTYTTSQHITPRHATTEPHPLNCPAPGECLPVQGGSGGTQPPQQSTATRLGAGAVAAGLPLEPRLSASSGALPPTWILVHQSASLSALLCVTPCLGQEALLIPLLVPGLVRCKRAGDFATGGVRSIDVGVYVVYFPENVACVHTYASVYI